MGYVLSGRQTNLVPPLIAVEDSRVRVRLLCIHLRVLDPVPFKKQRRREKMRTLHKPF